MKKIYHDEDIDLSILKGKVISVIGYGSQGKAQSQNMRDSGLDVVIGAAPKETFPDWDAAEKNGFKVLPIDECAKTADIVHILLPDPVQPQVYREQIDKNLRKGVTVSFSHGFNVTYNLITPPRDANVIAVVPEAPGPLLRELYAKGQGFFGTIAVERDVSGNSREIALAMAKAIGLTRIGVIETTFKKETESDNFVEQACIGGMIELFKACYETLVQGGYDPLQAYVKVVQEQQGIMDLLVNHGFEYTWGAVSDTCEFAGRTRGPRIVRREEINKILRETQKGEFARDWLLEARAGMAMMSALQREGRDSEIEKVGSEARELMRVANRTGR